MPGGRFNNTAFKKRAFLQSAHLPQFLPVLRGRGMQTFGGFPWLLWREPSLTNWSILRARKRLGSLTGSAPSPFSCGLTCPPSPALQGVLCPTYLLQQCIQGTGTWPSSCRGTGCCFAIGLQGALLHRELAWDAQGWAPANLQSSPGREMVFVRATVSAFNRRQRPRFLLLIPNDNLFIRMRYKHRAP